MNIYIEDDLLQVLKNCWTEIPKEVLAEAVSKANLSDEEIRAFNDRLVRKLNSKKRQRLTETWNVRGHYRHYKNGKKVYINPYTKGKKDGKTSRKSYHL